MKSSNGVRVSGVIMEDCGGNMTYPVLWWMEFTGRWEMGIPILSVGCIHLILYILPSTEFSGPTFNSLTYLMR